MKIRNGNSNKGFTAKPSSYPQGHFKDKECKWCNSLFSPQAPSHHYCSYECRDDASTNNYYLNNYGVTLEFVKGLYETQNKLCALCLKEGFKMLDTHSSGLSLDHCHDTGVVRGLLCHNCNRGLGLSKDEVSTLERAVDYVSKFKRIKKPPV